MKIDNEKYLDLVMQYNELGFLIKQHKMVQDRLKKQISAILSEANMDEYTYSGAKAIVIKSERKMYLKEKLIKKFGEKQLESCMKVIPVEQVRISYKEENGKE